MNLTDKQLQYLADRYFDGLTSEEEEQRLRQLLADSSVTGSTADELRAVMSYAAMTPPAPTLRSRERRHSRLGAIASTAAAVTVAVGIGVSVMLSGSPDSRTECMAFVDGNRIADPDAVMAIMEADLREFGEATDAVDSEISSDFSILSDAINQSSTTEP